MNKTMLNAKLVAAKTYTAAALNHYNKGEFAFAVLALSAAADHAKEAAAALAKKAAKKAKAKW